MEKGFKPIAGADGWQLSNAPILSMAALRASLEIFDLAGIESLRKKSIALTGYLHYLIQMLNTKNSSIKVITPTDPDARGCQLSLIISERGKELFEKLAANGVIVDWREPDVIRIAPVPLYNSFSEVFLFSSILDKALNFTA
jgi:kynureninase